MTEKTFEKIFDKLSHVNDRSVIFNNWLDYCIDTNLMQLQNHNTTTDFMDNEKDYYEMLSCWIHELNDKLQTEPFYDLIGELYEKNVQSRGKQKDFQQYFTPPDVTRLMADLTIPEEMEYNNRFCNDCCCGSGRFLLALHVKTEGEMYCIGQDLDETSCKMAVLNFWSHGVRGSVLHMNTITQEFYKGWRVNRWLHHGIPVPHIEEIYSVDEAFNFFGVDRSNKENNNDLKQIDEPAPRQTGQTTLI